MNELAKARAELALLEEQERQLLVRLRNVRSAVQVQKKRIDELVKHLIPPPISQLPVTAPYQIIYLTLNDGTQPAFAHWFTKRTLASVSRRWKNVILTFPGLWTTIVIHPSWSASLVIAHVQRSRECPLDIEIQGWLSRKSFSRFSELLGLVISCGYRWRSLIIWGNRILEDSIIKSIWNVMFPSLKRVTIHTTQLSDYPPFLDPHHARVLENLDLGESIRLDNFLAAASLKTLRLQCSPFGAPLLPSTTSLRTLTKLSIFGSSGALLPGSIHLPLLESLTVELEDPRSFLAAIVTPMLTYFSYSDPLKRGVRWSEIFADLEQKFSSVHHLCLKYSEDPPVGTDGQDAAAIYAAFPGACCIEMDILEFLNFCYAQDEDNPLFIADRWTHLERLSLENCSRWIPGDLVEWLRSRKLEGRPALKVTLSEFNTKDVLNGQRLISLYNSLHEYCLLEFKNIPLKFNLNLTDVYGNPPIINMLESAIYTELVYASTGTKE